MQDTNFSHPVLKAIAAEQSAVLVDDIEQAVAFLVTHGGIQWVTRRGNVLNGVLLGIEFCLTLVTQQKPHDRQHLEAPRTQGAHGQNRSQGRLHQGQKQVPRVSRRSQGRAGKVVQG